MTGLRTLWEFKGWDFKIEGLDIHNLTIENPAVMSQTTPFAEIQEDLWREVTAQKKSLCPCGNFRGQPYAMNDCRPNSPSAGGGGRDAWLWVDFDYQVGREDGRQDPGKTPSKKRGSRVNSRLDSGGVSED